MGVVVERHNRLLSLLLGARVVHQENDVRIEAVNHFIKTDREFNHQNDPVEEMLDCVGKRLIERLSENIQALLQIQSSLMELESSDEDDLDWVLV